MLEPARHERADAARNRATILVAAERLVGEHGAGAVTMDQIACAAGVGKGTLFRHFGDRCGLMRALLDERERSFQEDFIRGPAPLGPGAPPRERLVAFGERMLEHIEIQGDLLVAAENGAPGERLRHSVYAAYRAHVTALLRRQRLRRRRRLSGRRAARRAGQRTRALPARASCAMSPRAEPAGAAGAELRRAGCSTRDA